MVVRDSTGARTDGLWPSRLQLYVDGVPMIDSTMNELYDDSWITFGAVTSARRYARDLAKEQPEPAEPGPVGRRRGVPSTNPGTLLEANFTPAGAGSNSPATMSALVGQTVPTGSIIQGLPEL
jgi:hypothetical protein